MSDVDIIVPAIRYVYNENDIMLNDSRVSLDI